MDRSRELDLSSPEGIVRAARRSIGMVEAMFYAPGIPPDKLAKARAVHALHLPEEEPVLVLYDGTLFGSGALGFVVTSERLCWKNLWEHPRQIPWDDVDPLSIKRESGQVGVAGGRVLVSTEIAAGAAAFFALMAERSSASKPGPYRVSPPAPELSIGAGISTARIVALTRQHVGEAVGLYIHPSIPPSKLEKAREAHVDHLPEDEVVAVLFDDTVFGGARDGFLITSRRLCWKNFSASAQWMFLCDIEPEKITEDKSFVCVMGGEIQVTTKTELIGSVVRLLRAVVEEAKAQRTMVSDRATKS